MFMIQFKIAHPLVLLDCDTLNSTSMVSVMPHLCDICQTTYASQSNLNSHLLSHTDLRSFKCKQCSKTFKRKSHLTRHIKTHSEKPKEKTFQCTKCSKSYAEQYELNHHFITHTKKRNFACELCDKRYVYNCELNRHMRRIHSPKPSPPSLPCTHCGTTLSIDPGSTDI